MDTQSIIPREWLEEFEAAARRPLPLRFRYAFIHTYKPVLDDARTGRLTRCRITVVGAKRTFPIGLVMAAFEYRQAEEIRDAFHAARRSISVHRQVGRHSARLSRHHPRRRLVRRSFARELPGAGQRAARGWIRIDRRSGCRDQRGKDFVQLKNGPFDLDLVFAPDGIERFEDAWRRHVEVEGFLRLPSGRHHRQQGGHNRAKDHESLPRLRSFREYWMNRNHGSLR